MKAMILAAGRGERMRPLTDKVPKALLEAGGRPLIVHLIERLARAGFRELVINVSHLAGAIELALGNGSALGVTIAYSREATALETGGGIAYALPLLGEGPFIAVNCDVYSDFDLDRLRMAADALEAGRKGAHLVLVDNPPHHRAGDFGLKDGAVTAEAQERLTFSGMSAYVPRFFAAVERGSRCQLAGLLRPAMARGEVSGERHPGLWMDIGTPQRLAELERLLVASGHA
jgi:MurNAc alpha-1-phosphate uridylyltransferase